MAATNVDDLVAFLLDEIALWGEEGTSRALGLRKGPELLYQNCVSRDFRWC